MSATPGDAMRPFFSSQAAATKGSYNLAGIADPAIDALIEKIIAADNRGRSDHRLPRASTGCFAPDATGCRNGIAPTIPSPIGMCSAIRKSRRAIAQGVGAPENWWYDAAKAAEARAGEIVHERLYRPPHSPDDPDAAGNPVRVVRGGAVRAGRPGGAGDRAAHRRRYRRHLADFGRRRRFRRARPGRHGRRCRRLEISRRAGARSRIHQEPGKAVRLRQAGAGTLRADAVEFRALRFRQELFPRRQRAATDQGEAAGLDVARASG